MDFDVIYGQRMVRRDREIAPSSTQNMKKEVIADEKYMKNTKYTKKNGMSWSTY